MEIDCITIDAFVEIWIYFNRLINRETYTYLRLTVKRRHERDIQQSGVVHELVSLSPFKWIVTDFISLFHNYTLRHHTRFTNQWIGNVTHYSQIIFNVMAISLYIYI